MSDDDERVGLHALRFKPTAEATLVYLPAYSPDFNPIEMAFSKFKALLRAAAPRTIPKLWQAISDAIDRFKPDE